jgi:DNA-binding FadR family transcriptional regulator
LGAITLAFATGRPGGPWYVHYEPVKRHVNGEQVWEMVPVPADQVTFGNILYARENLEDERARLALNNRLSSQEWASLTDLHNRCNVEVHLHALREQEDGKYHVVLDHVSSDNAVSIKSALHRAGVVPDVDRIHVTNASKTSPPRK